MTAFRYLNELEFMCYALQIKTNDLICLILADSKFRVR